MKKVTSLVVALMALTCLSCCSTKKGKTTTTSEKKQETVKPKEEPKQEPQPGLVDVVVRAVMEKLSQKQQAQ